MADLLPPAFVLTRCCRIEFYEQHGLRDWGSKFGPPCAGEAVAIGDASQPSAAVAVAESAPEGLLPPAPSGA